MANLPFLQNNNISSGTIQINTLWALLTGASQSRLLSPALLFGSAALFKTRICISVFCTTLKDLIQVIEHL